MRGIQIRRGGEQRKKAKLAFHATAIGHRRKTSERQVKGVNPRAEIAFVFMRTRNTKVKDGRSTQMRRGAYLQLLAVRARSRSANAVQPIISTSSCQIRQVRQTDNTDSIQQPKEKRVTFRSTRCEIHSGWVVRCIPHPGWTTSGITMPRSHGRMSHVTFRRPQCHVVCQVSENDDDHGGEYDDHGCKLSGHEIHRKEICQ